MPSWPRPWCSLILPPAVHLLRRAAELDDPAAAAEGLQVLAAQRAIVSWGRLRRAHVEAKAQIAAAAAAPDEVHPC